MPIPPVLVPAISPRVLLSIDYEPWFAFIRRYDATTASQARKELDGGYSCSAIDGILEQLGNVKASFYLVGEIAEWYPEVPQKIVAAGHELGLHCQIHRPLVNPSELEKDIHASQRWRDEYHVRGYRAPMVGISEGGYALLREAGFLYSSSIYAQPGRLLQKDGIWEMPVSTTRLFGRHQPSLLAPRHFSFGLLLNGEMPYGSSFTIGVMSDLVSRLIERDLKQGLSPVIFLHPYELVRPDSFLRRTFADLLWQPKLVPFVLDKSKFLKKLIQRFPVSPLGTYLDEALLLQESLNA